MIHWEIVTRGKNMISVQMKKFSNLLLLNLRRLTSIPNFTLAVFLFLNSEPYNENRFKNKHIYEEEDDGTIFEDHNFEFMFQNSKGGKKKVKRCRKKLKILMLKSSKFKVPVELNFMESVTGCEKILEFERIDQCSTCKGKKSRVGYSTKDCTYCKGKGSTYVTNGVFMIQVECDECNGEGSVIKNPCM